MQYTITVDTAAVATASGKDPAAVDSWLTGNAGTAEKMVTESLVQMAKDSGIAAAPPPAPADTGQTGATGPAASGADADAAARLVALEAALDTLPPGVREMVRERLDAEVARTAPGGVGI